MRSCWSIFPLLEMTNGLGNVFRAKELATVISDKIGTPNVEENDEMAVDTEEGLGEGEWETREREEKLDIQCL